MKKEKINENDFYLISTKTKDFLLKQNNTAAIWSNNLLNINEEYLNLMKTTTKNKIISQVELELASLIYISLAFFKSFFI
jgi:hypothetical protein